MNFNMVTWWTGDIRRSSFKTPIGDCQHICLQFKLMTKSLTMQNSSLCHHLFHMILGLRENEEDVRDSTLDDLGQLSFLVQDSTQDERKRV